MTQPGLFSYNLVTGAFDTSFRPVIAGGTVSTLAASADGTAVFVGGNFATVNGTTQRRLAKLNLNGTLNTTFKVSVNSVVSKVSVLGSRLFIGGPFSTVNGKPRALLAELNATTGALAAGFTLGITGTAAVGGYTTVQALEVSPDGTRLLVAHNGAQVGGQDRYGVAVIDIAGPTATLDPWYTNLWKDNLFRNGGVDRVTNAAWGPTSTWFVTTNTGGDRPPTNDSVQRFDVSGPGPLAPTWVTRQFDSSYSVAIAPDGTIYVGGHFRYTEAPGSTEPWPGNDNTNYGFGPAGGARVLGSEVVGRMQIDALNPGTGKALNWYGTADGQHGVTALMVVGSVLLVGHDGQRVGGLLYGAHGQLPTYGAARDTTKPLSSVDAPLMGAVLDVGAVHVTGHASSPAGVAKVGVEVKRGTQWLHADGTWARSPPCPPRRPHRAPPAPAGRWI